MVQKRKEKDESRAGAPTNRKRKTPITGRDNARLDVSGSGSATNSRSDMVDGEPQLEGDIKVELDSDVKVEPMEDGDTQQGSLGDLDNGAPDNMDNGEVRKMFMRDFKAENQAENHGGVRFNTSNESDFTSREPKPEKGVDAIPSGLKTCTCKAKVSKSRETEVTSCDPKPEKNLPVSSPSSNRSLNGPKEQYSIEVIQVEAKTTTECENVAVTGEEENTARKGNSKITSHSDYWKLKATEMATQKFELEKKTWEFEADFAVTTGEGANNNEKGPSDKSSASSYWKLKSEELAGHKLVLEKKTWDLEADLAYWKDKAKELERTFIEIEQAEPVELKGSQSTAGSCPVPQETSSGSFGTSDLSPISPIPPMDKSSDATGGKTGNMSSSDSSQDVVRQENHRKRTNCDEVEKKWTIEPGVGKYKCRLCPDGADYASIKGVHLHYDRVHLKRRFKCKICGKDFTQKGGYDIHHQSVHLGVRFPCKRLHRKVI